jgi:hypothetical protein
MIAQDVEHDLDRSANRRPQHRAGHRWQPTQAKIEDRRQSSRSPAQNSGSLAGRGERHLYYVSAGGRVGCFCPRDDVSVQLELRIDAGGETIPGGMQLVERERLVAGLAQLRT